VSFGDTIAGPATALAAQLQANSSASAPWNRGMFGFRGIVFHPWLIDSARLLMIQLTDA
jgi:hypothetical protein